MSSNTLDPRRLPRKTKALKADRTVHRITFNPSSAKSGETLYVTMPKLGEGMVFVPYSTFLRFNLTIEMGQANNTVAQNVGRNLVQNFKVIFGGKTIADVERADLYGAYHDMVTCEEDMMMGITSESYRKLRTGAGDKSTDAKEVMHTGRYGNTYHIPLSHPILDDHGVFYQKEMEDLRFEIKLPNKGEIVVTSDSAKDHDFELTNIRLEYCTIRDDGLSAQAASEYQDGRTFVFDDVHLFQTVPAINLATQKSLSLHVNTPRRCMKGLMLFFVKNYAAGARDAEQFVMPLVTDVSVTIDGVPHKLFSDGMKSTDLWNAVKQKMGYDKRLHGHFKEQDFHNHKFALWVDLRASPDNWLHGDGLIVGRSKDGVRIEISWTGMNGVVVNCYAFVVSDAALFVKEGRVKQFFLQPSSSD